MGPNEIQIRAMLNVPWSGYDAAIVELARLLDEHEGHDHTHEDEDD